MEHRSSTSAGQKWRIRAEGAFSVDYEPHRDDLMDAPSQTTRTKRHSLRKLVRVLALPEVVTHRYDPAVGVCLNICSLPDSEAERVLDRLRRTSRPKLKPTYLARRRSTEHWLSEAAAYALGRRIEQLPAYFFLGDFSHAVDPSRPATFAFPVSTLPRDATTFTLGDSMSVAEQTTRKVYTLDEFVALFAAGEAIADFGFSDRHGFQTRFVEVHVWDRAFLFAHTPETADVRVRTCRIDDGCGDRSLKGSQAASLT